MTTPPLSIVVPAYQADRTLATCLESLEPLLPDVATVILVDDGSTDDTEAVARAWCDDHAGIYVRQANAGVGAALARGLKEVRTPHVSFVQADDWIDARVWERMVYLISTSHADIVRCTMALVADGGRVLGVVSREGIGPREVPPRRLVTGIPAVPTGVYRMDFLRNHRISFGSLRYAEDLPFIYACARHAQHILSIDEIGYFYRQHPSGQLSARRDTTPEVIAALSICRPPAREPLRWRGAYWRMAARALAGGFRRTPPLARRRALKVVFAFVRREPSDIPVAIAGASLEAIAHGRDIPRYVSLMRRGGAEWSTLPQAGPRTQRRR